MSRFNKGKFKHSHNKKPQHKKDYEKDSGCKIVVRNGDVNGAIRRLKKVLERADRQKELAKREYYEKPSVARKRKKAAAVKRTKKAQDDMIARGEWMPTERVGTRHLKGKRQKRKAWMVREKVERLRNRGR